MTTEQPYKLFVSHELPCIVMRGPLNQWNGYVGAPLAAIGDLESFRYAADDFRVHGGVTYNDEICPLAFLEAFGHTGVTYNDAINIVNLNLHWIGFDTAHARDYIEGYPYNLPGAVKRTREYVEAQTVKLAEQVAAFILART